jgi:SAM-dependent methyltransferase
MQEHVIAFEPRRFEGAAPHYLQGRPPYAAALYRRVALLVGLGHRDRVLDLGCGPGQLAAGFAYFAESVLAMDPEPEMLAIAQARGEGTLTNVTYLQGSSYDLSAELGQTYGPFLLTTIGRAFHWMDRAETLRQLESISTQDAAVALFSDVHPKVSENDWMPTFREIRQRYTGEDRAAWRQPDWPSHETILLASPFCRLERIGVIERRHIPPERLVDRALSMSSSSRTKLGAKVDAFAQEVAEFAKTLARDGWVEEVVESTALIGFRSG